MNSILRKYKNLLPNVLLDRFSKWKYLLGKRRDSEIDMKQVFESIYHKNEWGSEESKSGQGSTIDNSYGAKKALEKIIQELNIKSILDVPCGDFNWLKHVNLFSVKYIGADIVDQMVLDNQLKYGSENIQFKRIDITEDSIEKYDLILVRDLFVHFSYSDVKKSIETLKHSNSTYLLTTTFVDFTVNYNIDTGSWRPINLSKKPFRFPKPIMTFEETFHPQFKKEARGKSLALWEIKNL